MFAVQAAFFLLCNIIGLFTLSSQQCLECDGKQEHLISLLRFVLWYHGL